MTEISCRACGTLPTDRLPEDEMREDQLPKLCILKMDCIRCGSERIRDEKQKEGSLPDGGHGESIYFGGYLEPS